VQVSAPVDGPTAIGVFAHLRRGSREAIQVVMAKVCFHVSKTDYFVAHVAFSCATAVDEFVRCQSRKENFWVEHVGVRVTLLGHDEVTKLAEYGLASASRGAMMSESW